MLRLCLLFLLWTGSEAQIRKYMARCPEVVPMENFNFDKVNVNRESVFNVNLTFKMFFIYCKQI